MLGLRLGPALAPRNRAALALTAAAIGIGALSSGGRGALVAWLIGHFAWGTYLAREVWHGRAGFAPADK
jgi:hypothetical protein